MGLIIDSSGAPMQPASSPVRMQARDGLGTALASIGNGGFGGGYQQGPLSQYFALDLAFAAYLGSGLLQKVIDIPAADRTREWRDWQAESDQITAIEAEEKRLGLRAKIKAAEVLRGIGGGALILALPGNPPEPAPAPSRGQLQAVNLVSRKQLQLVDIDEDLTSPTYGEPRLFRFQAQGRPVDIHPSRVIPFRGDAYPPMMAGITAEDLYWGRSKLVRVVNEVSKSDNAALWFSHLIRKAKLLRFGISNLGDYDQDALNQRVAMIATGENILNATLYNLPAGDAGGEKIDDFTMTWNGIPAIMDAFDQRVAAVADIPFTRLMGRSPAGMNATGEHDTANWYAAVGAAQELELRPCLERLDAVMLPSAGVDPRDLWWKFSPLGKPTPEQEAARFKTTMEALKVVAELNAMPDAAVNAGVQGVIEENGWMPGSLPILAEMDEDERFGVNPDPDGSDPSAITQSGSGVEGGDPTSRQAPGASVEAEPRRRAANDAKPIPLYVQRKLLNADELIRWAKAQGFKSTLDASDMHVTVLYSRTPVDPIKMGTTWADNEKGELTVKPGGPRAVEKLGESAVVLLFASDDLSWRHRGMVEAGASHDYDEYQPHVTLTYEAGDVDLDAIKPFTGALRFGPEIFEPLNLDWKSKVVEQ